MAMRDEQADREQHLEAPLLWQALDRVDQAVLVMDAARARVVALNQAARRWLGASDTAVIADIQALLPANLWKQLPKFDGPSAVDPMSPCSIPIDAANGRSLVFHFTPHSTAGRFWIGVSTCAPDESRQAPGDGRDDLTGLASRSALRRKYAVSVGPSNDVRLPAECVLLFIDLDNFKAVNDVAGHLVGDEVLRRIAHRLQDSLRPGDFVGRFGGDEFLVVIEGVGSVSQAEAVAARIVAAIAQPIEAGNQTWCITASIGISFSGAAGRSLDTTLQAADRAMYAAKASSEDIIAFEPDERAPRRP